jgi:hypothetical protein
MPKPGVLNLIGKEESNMAKILSELELVVKFKEAREKLNQLKEAATEAQVEFDQVEGQLIERLQDEGKDATARFDGIGYVGLSKASVYASYAAENKDSVFKFLRSRKRQDLIQKTVNARSLSTYVKELIDKGRKIPACISYYLKTSARFYAEKGN